LYELYGYAPPQGLWFLNRFGQKIVMNFTHLVMKVSVMVSTPAVNLTFAPYLSFTHLRAVSPLAA